LKRDRLIRIIQVDRQEIGVLGRVPARVPDRELWIVAEVSRVGRINPECVKVPAARDGVVGLRHTDALPVRVATRKSVKSHIAYQPAIFQRIVERKRVSQIVVGAGGARQPGKERIKRDRVRNGRSTVLMIDHNISIDRFDIIVKADVAIVVRH
jgi:hypothetical protein